MVYELNTSRDGGKYSCVSGDNCENKSENTLSDTIREIILCQQPHIHPMLILNILLGVSSFIVNVLVLCVVVRKRGSTYSSYRHLVISLISSYLILAVCWITIWSLAFNNETRCMAACCRCFDAFLVLLFNVGVIASVLHMLAMSVEHYVALFMPLRFKVLFTKPRMTLTLIALWIFSTLCSCSSFSQALYTYYRSNDTTVNFCQVFLSENSDQILHYTLLAILAVSMVTLGCIYVRICLDTHPPCHHRGYTNGVAGHRAQRKLLQTTLLIWGVFVACWTPFILLTLKVSTSDFGSLACHTRIVLMYLSSMPVVNSLCGPVVYTFRSHTATDVRKTLCCTMDDRH